MKVGSLIKFTKNDANTQAITMYMEEDEELRWRLALVILDSVISFRVRFFDGVMATFSAHQDGLEILSEGA